MLAIEKSAIRFGLAILFVFTVLSGCGKGSGSKGEDAGTTDDQNTGAEPEDTGSEREEATEPEEDTGTGDEQATETEAGTETETETETETQSTACILGSLGCRCDNGVCTVGECVGGVCVDCEAGELDCVCLSNDVCNAGLRCEDGICQECPAGEEGCPCDTGDACEGDLVCISGVCVTEDCTVGSVGCPCRDEGDDPRCDGNAYCAASNLCVACSIDVAGCPCGDAGVCGEGLRCNENQVCEEVLDCNTLRERGECGEHQVCNDADAGPECVEGECEGDWEWDDDLGDCTIEQTCEIGLSNSLVEECLNQNRECNQTAAGAECGDCLPGAEEVDGVCMRNIICGDAECADDEYCDRFVPDGAGGFEPRCQPWPCSDLTQVMDASGECVSCSGSCDTEGSTGRFWAFHDAEGKCVCETRPGNYDVAGGGQLPEKCDADHDGWVRDDVGKSIYSAEYALDNADTPTSQTMAQNARCDIRRIDRVVLVDEFGTGLTVWSCEEEGLVTQHPGEDMPTCGEPHVMMLLETERNDKPNNPQILNDDALIYGGENGRHFRADEMNALTKACTSLNGDFNDNQVNDIQEVQDTREDTSTLTGEARLQSFSYFVELYTSRYEKLDGDAYGMLVISERSRCDSEWFVLSYDNNLEYDPATESTYWRNCERRRDPGFDADDNTVGFDFAQYSCDSRTASCPELPPAHAEYDAYEGWGPDDPPIRDHGLCELAMEDAAPADGLWRGMNHHSQFKCVRIIQANEEPDAVHKKRPDEFGLNAAYTFNSCTVQDCGSTADCVQSQTVSDDPIEAKYPVFECTATDEMPAVGAVGWAAVNYSPYGHATAGETEDGQPILIPATDTYNGGCINEDAQWEYLCPYPEYGWETEPPLDAYGRYHCYCWEGMFLWAPDDTVGVCNEPCPDAGVCIECETPGVADCSPLQCDWSGNAGYNPRSALIWSADGVDAGVNGSVWAPDEPDMSACEE